MADKPSLDGFVTRRANREAGELHTASKFSKEKNPQDDVSGLRRRTAALDDKVAPTSRDTAKATGMQGLSRSDIDESLREIDANQETPKTKKQKRPKVPKSRRRRIVKWIIILIILAGLGLAGWVAAKTFMASQSIFKGDIFGLIQQKKLEQDANGRTNILILGTSEDDPGHPGAYLTDSIMVLSVDQTNKNAYMISVPRDLYVKYGMACNSGYSGKINEYFNCVNSDWTTSSAEDERQTAARKFFGDIVGLNIQYSVHVNYTVLRDIVGALGGITVTIESRDPGGQMDSNFDWKCKDGNAYASLATMKRICPPNGHFIDYPNGPVNLDAEHALYLAQARGDIAPTYGFEQSNFDREKNQQKILVAIKDKAMSSGTLTNLGKVTGIIDALGKNLRTNFSTSEIRTLVNLAKDMPSSAIQSLSLIDAEPPLVTTADVPGAGSVVVPSAGTFDYSQIQSYIRKKLLASPVAKEDAHIVVLNASGVGGAAQTQANALSDLGMTIDNVGNAPDSSYTANVIYQVAQSAKPNTAQKLAQLYGVTPKVVTSIPNVTVDPTTDFVIVLVNPPATGAVGTTSP